MDLSIQELRLLLGSFFINPNRFMSQEEFDEVKILLSSDRSFVSLHGQVFTKNDLVNQALLYDTLDYYIKLLNKLLGFRPLNF